MTKKLMLEAIRYRVHEAGLSISHLEKWVDLNQSTLSKVDSGKTDLYSIKTGSYIALVSIFTPDEYKLIQMSETLSDFKNNVFKHIRFNLEYSDEMEVSFNIIKPYGKVEMTLTFKTDGMIQTYKLYDSDVIDVCMNNTDISACKEVIMSYINN